METFERDGISFRYPSDWTVETADDPETGGWAATVTSPETAFVLVSVQPDASDPADLADQTLPALRGEYKELDVEDVTEPVAGRPAIGFDADFLTVDTPTTCRVRCLDTPVGPVLVLAQVSEFDRERNDPLLRAVVASLKVNEE